MTEIADVDFLLFHELYDGWESLVKLLAGHVTIAIDLEELNVI